MPHGKTAIYHSHAIESQKSSKEEWQVLNLSAEKYQRSIHHPPIKISNELPKHGNRVCNIQNKSINPF